MFVNQKPDKYILIYYSCAEEDRKHLVKLDKHLAVLRQQASVITWHDGLVKVGEQREQMIATHLAQAQIIVLLLSPDYLDTGRCREQMERAMEYRDADGVQVVPVLLRPTTGWEQTPIGRLQPLPIGARPVISWTNYDEALANVANGIFRVVEQLSEQRRRIQVSGAGLHDMPPPHRHSTILQRNELVQDIYTMLTQTECSALILTGPGGGGKSTLAAQIYSYAEEQRSLQKSFFNYEALWIRIRPTVTMVEMVTRISEARGQFLYDLTHRSPQELASELFNLLDQADTRQLIVLDQCEEWLQMQTGMPRSKYAPISEWFEVLNGYACASRFLITSRVKPQSVRMYRQMYMQDIYIQGLQGKEGLDLLKLWNIQGKTKDLIRALERCQGNLMALVLLEQTVRNYHVNIATLLDDTSYRHLWVENVGHNLFNDLYEQMNEVQRQVLTVLCIYREAVSGHAISAVLSGLMNITEEQVIFTLRVLFSLGLMQIQSDEKSYELYPLVAEFVLLRIKEQEKAEKKKDRYRLYAEIARYYLHQFTLRFLPLEQRCRMDDVTALVEAAWHFCQAEEWEKGYALIKQEQLFTLLLRWGEYEVLLELYTLLLPSTHWHPETALAACIYNEIGQIKYSLGYKREAQDDFEQALKHCRAAGVIAEEVKVLNNLGLTYRSLGQVEQAIEYYQVAMDICEGTDEEVEKGVTLNNLGRSFQSLGRQAEQAKIKNKHYRRANTYYEQALVLHRERKDSAEIARTLNNLGEIYYDLGKWDKAIGYYRQALKLFRVIRERRGEGIACNNFGVLYRTLWRMQEAFEYYVQALKIFQDIGDSWEEAVVLRNLGRLYLLAQDNEVALAFFLRAKGIYEKLHMPEQGAIPVGFQAALASGLSIQDAIAAVYPRAMEIIETALEQGLAFP